MLSSTLLPAQSTVAQQVKPDDHSKSVPPLPIPNRTVKRHCDDDSAATSVKVVYRQASYKEEAPPALRALKIARSAGGAFLLCGRSMRDGSGLKYVAIFYCCVPMMRPCRGKALMQCRTVVSFRRLLAVSLSLALGACSWGDDDAPPPPPPPPASASHLNNEGSDFFF